MLVLPFGARAENISGAMYTAPAAASNNHPAPTTQANAPYGRIDIDTTDQEHIATTAYVKGAYNSAIAAVNNVAGELNSLGTEMGYSIMQRQGKLYIENDTSATISDNVAGVVASPDEIVNYVLGDSAMKEQVLEQSSDRLATLAGIAVSVDETFNAKKVAVYTTWGNDNAKTPVALANITDF